GTPDLGALLERTGRGGGEKQREQMRDHGAMVAEGLRGGTPFTIRDKWPDPAPVSRGARTAIIPLSAAPARCASPDDPPPPIPARRSGARGGAGRVRYRAILALVPVPPQGGDGGSRSHRAFRSGQDPASQAAGDRGAP